MKPSSQQNLKENNLLVKITQGSVFVKYAIIFQLILLAWMFTPQFNTNGDNARYFMLGESLALGKGYRVIYEPSMPKETAYPIAFPLLLALFHLIFDSPLLLKICIAYIAVFQLLLLYRLFNGRTDNKLLVLLIIFTATSGMICEYSIDFMSEVPYLLSSLLAMFLLVKSKENPKKTWLFLLSILASVLPVNCRSIGLSFSAAWICCNLLEGHYRYALMHSLLLIVTLVAFRLYAGATTPYILQLLQRSSYYPDAGLVTAKEMIQRIVYNIGLYSLKIIPQTVVPASKFVPPAVVSLFAKFILFFAFIGWLRNFFTSLKFLSVYVLFYFAILVVWQSQWSSERFVICVLPFIFYFVLLGLNFLIHSFDANGQCESLGFFRKITSSELIVSGAAAKIALGLSVIIVAINCVYVGCQGLATKSATNDWANFFACADWVRHNTPKNAIVMSRKPELFYLRSLRKGVVYPLTHNIDAVISAIEKNNVSYVIYDNFFWTKTSARYLYPAITSNLHRFRIVYALKNPDTFVLEFIKK